jgi:hypothetical protein
MKSAYDILEPNFCEKANFKSQSILGAYYQPEFGRNQGFLAIA